MNYQEVRKLVKERAGTKYRGTQLHLLQKLTNTLYTEREEADVEHTVVDRKVSTMCGWIGVSDRQLRNLLKGLGEVTVVRWHNGVISYTMTFDKLKDLETLRAHTKRKSADQRADRAQRARARRAELRELERVIYAVKDALHKDMAEYLTKLAREKRGKAVAEAMIEKFCEGNPGDPLTEKLRGIRG